MEIERKFLIKKEDSPIDWTAFPHHELEQAYIITEPVLRLRKKDDSYILTYKGTGFLKREETEFPLTETAYRKLLTKSEGNIIKKTRYLIPEENDLTIELDQFHGILEGLYLAEVEFPTEEAAMLYTPPVWFDKEVTHESTFHNSTLSCMTNEEISRLLQSL